MIPYTSRSLAKKLQTSANPLPSPDPTPLLPFLYPRWYATSNNTGEHDAISKKPFSPRFQQFGAADLSSTSVDLPRNGTVSPSLFGPRGRTSELQNVVQKRVQRLPRSKLKSSSGLQTGLRDRIATTPTFKTCRDDIETIFKGTSNEEVARNTARLARMKSIYRSHPVDWVPIARKLLRMTGTQSTPLPEAILELSEDFVEQYVGSCRYNKWIFRVGSGTEINLLPATVTGNGKRRLLLYGSSRSVDLAVKTLRRQQDYFALSGKLESETNNSSGLETVVSVASFSSYVRRLILHRLPRQIQQETGKTRNESIAAALIHVFLDPTASKFANTYALSRALTYVCRHDELQDSADSLYARAKQLGLRPDVTTFNILIGQAIRCRKVSKTTSLLDEMHGMGVSINGHTWALFLTAGSSTVPISIEYRLNILSLMREARVHLNTRARHDIVQWMIVEDFSRLEDSKEAFSQTLNHFDHLFGKTWFNNAAYRKMVHTVNARPTRLRILPGLLLDLPVQRGLPANRNIEMLRLYVHRHRKDVIACIDDLCKMLRRNDGKQLEIPVAYAFMTAWDRYCANVCRVLWRYAASHGSILHTMQSVVNGSLLYNASESQDIVENWRRKAGSIIAGVDIDTAGFKDAFPRLSQYCSHYANPMEWLTVFTPDNGTRDEQISLAYVMINRDLTAWKRYQPMTNDQLEYLLEAAEQRDRDWKNELLLTNVPASELIERAITVPLHARGSVLQIDGVNLITGLSATDEAVRRTQNLTSDLVVDCDQAEPQEMEKGR